MKLIPPSPSNVSVLIFILAITLQALHSAAASSNDTTVTSSNSNISTTRSTKRGLIIGRSVTRSMLGENFNDGAVSWFYNYGHRLKEWELEWADSNNVEYVPMISKAELKDTDGEALCIFGNITRLSALKRTARRRRFCKLQVVIKELQSTIAARANGIPVRYLMGFNEMYNNGPPIDLTPEEAADYWRFYVQPAAIATNLTLVSPTTKGNDKGVTWFSEFLRICYDHRYDEQHPCDIDLIQKFAVHEYKCKASSWEQIYGDRGDASSLFITTLTNEMGNYGGKNESEWRQFLQNRDLWVTETNCYWEKLELKHPDSKEQCLRITGQLPESHGAGSVALMEQASHIERYSWWTTWNPQLKPNYLTYKSGQLTPIGRGYFSINCEFEGKRLDAEEAVLNSSADLAYCDATGTHLIK